MWEVELDILVKDGGYHDINYRLKNGNVVPFMIRGVRYYGKYCIVAESRTYSDNSYWFERIFTISKIQSIDNVQYEQSVGYQSYLEKLEEERMKKQRKASPSSSSSSVEPEAEAKFGCMGFFGMAGLVVGGALGGGIGAIVGIVLGSFLALLIFDWRFNN